MPLEYHHQLNLLRDILQDHMKDCNGSPAECAQLERLAANLMANETLHDDVRSALRFVNDYSHTGTTHTALNSHIESHLPHIENWLNTIETHHTF